MNEPTGWLQAGGFLLVVTLLVAPAGAYLARVFGGGRTWLDPLCAPVERLLYRVCGIDSEHAMEWAEYARAFVWLGLVGTLALYALLRLQQFLPWYDPRHLTTPMTPDLAANTALSFNTTTTWQAYGGETTMSYVSQLVGLAGGSFLAGAAGLTVGIAFIRGLAAPGDRRLGNFWVDVVRAMLWVLLPLSLLGGIVLVWQGVPMTFAPYVEAHTLEGSVQTIARGPVAALEFIKQLGTNGGGFFNVNGAHPFANPTPPANFLGLLAIAVLPASLTYTFGRMTGRPRDGWLLYGVMAALFVAAVVANTIPESAGIPAVSRVIGAGGNMEGKEVRFGVPASALAAVVTSNGATGSYIAMHDSFTPLGGMVPLVNMLLGEIVFGGLGTGLVSMLLVALLALFVIGLMIGRTPAYQGKVLGPGEMKMIVLYTVIAPLGVLVPTALAVVTPAGLAGLTTNTGPHGFTEILYAFASTFATNGQTFAGLSANTPFYNVVTMVAMVLGRFALGITALALAGQFASRRRRSGAELGSVPTGSLLFGAAVVGTALIVGALTFAPALALGPVVEALQIHSVTSGAAP
jgi:K+-transporting ATPase ATPase A chain